MVKITYINEVFEIDPIKIINDLISQIESTGEVYNKSDIMEERYNNYIFNVVDMIFF